MSAATPPPPPCSPGPHPRTLLLAALAALTLAALATGLLPWALPALALWLAALGRLAPAALRRVWRPRFVLLSALLALLAGLVLAPPDAELAGVPLSTRGLVAGLLMVLRSAFVVTAMSWGATLALARAARYSPTRRPLGAAAATAAQLLPEVVTTLASDWSTRSRAPGARGAEGLAVATLARAAALADRLATPAGPRLAERWALLGDRGSGKTLTLTILRDTLRATGFRVGGILQPTIDPDRRAYAVEDVATGERRPLAQRASAAPDAPFVFDAEAWAWAAERLRAARTTCDVVIADELGRLEALGGGHMAALTEPLAGETARLWLLGVRASTAPMVEAQLGPWDRALPAALAHADPRSVARAVLTLLDTPSTPEPP